MSRVSSFSQALLGISMGLKKKPTIILSREDYDEIFNELTDAKWMPGFRYENDGEFILYGVLVKREE